MGQSSERKQVSIRLTPGKAKQLASNLEMLRQLYGSLMVEWERLSEAQRAEILAHSPVLAGYLALFGGGRG